MRKRLVCTLALLLLMARMATAQSSPVAQKPQEPVLPYSPSLAREES